MKSTGFCLAAILISNAWGQGGFAGPGRYEIANVRSGKVMDLDRNDRTTVIQFSSRGTNNQIWFVQPAEPGFYFLRNGMNGDALTAVSDRNSSPVEGHPFRGDPSQQWRIEEGRDGGALIVSRLGKALDIPDGTGRDGVRIQVYDRNGEANQRFIFRRVEGRWERESDRWWEREERLERREGPPGGPVGGPVLVTCASDDGRRRDCPSDTRGQVVLTRQISGSPCIEGQTWGFDPRGIWVDRGCRAEFEVRRQPESAVVACASDDGRRRNCPADTRGGVQLVRQVSGSPCIEGQTWGFDERGIWVDRGCRAEFQLRGAFYRR